MAENQIVRANTGLAIPPPLPDNDIVVTAGIGGPVVHVSTKIVKINGRSYRMDPAQLIRMIKTVTQTIGEYKNMDNPNAAYIINAMRKGRSDMVSDLESHFRIHWKIDENGNSFFWM